MRHTHHDIATDHPRRDWMLMALAIAGLGISIYLTAVRLAGAVALFCDASSPCATVQASRYGTFLALPTAAWGALLYAGVVTLALTGLTRARWIAALVLTVSAASFSLYLTYLEIFEIKAVCPYCVASLIIALAMAGVVIVRVPRSKSGRLRVPRSRVIAIGTVTAIVTIVGAMGVFVGQSVEASAPYRSALARHLASTGAVMYGAYW